VSLSAPCSPSVESNRRATFLDEPREFNTSSSFPNKYVNFVCPNVNLDELLSKSQGVPTFYLSAGSYKLQNIATKSAIWVLSEFSVLNTKFEPKTPVHVSITGGTITSFDDSILFRLNVDSSTVLVRDSRIISENSAIVVTSEGNYKFIGCSIRTKGANACIRVFRPCELDLRILESESVCLDSRTRFEFKCDKLVSKSIGITNNSDNNFLVGQMKCDLGIRNDAGNLRLSSNSIFCNNLCNINDGNIYINSKSLEFNKASGKGKLSLVVDELLCNGTISCNVDINSDSALVNTETWITGTFSKLILEELEFNGNCIIKGEESDLNINNLKSEGDGILLCVKKLSGKINKINASSNVLFLVDVLDVKLNNTNVLSLGSVNMECDLRFHKLTSKIGITVSGKTRISGNYVRCEQEFLRILSGDVCCDIRHCVAKGLSDPDPDKAQGIIRLLQSAGTLRLSGYYECSDTHVILLELFGKQFARLELHNTILRSGKPSIRMIGGYSTIVTLDCINSSSSSEPEIDSGTIVYSMSKLIIG
jgi:hypothetical protein